MNFERIEIEREIQKELASRLPADDLVRTRAELALKLLWRVTFSPDLGRDWALREDLPVAFQSFFRDAVGKTSSLNSLRATFESVLKAIAYSARLRTKAEVASQSFMLIKTLKALNLSAELTQSGSGAPDLNSPKSTFAGRPEYLREIASAYQVRNEIHMPPDLGIGQVLEYGIDLVIVMLYACLKHEAALMNLPEVGWEAARPSNGNHQHEMNRYFYDFMSLGDTPNNIRNKLIDCYIVGKLYSESNIQKDGLRTATNAQFELQLSKQEFASVLERLKRERKIATDLETGLMSLTESERNRLSAVKTDYETNKELFDLYFDDLLHKWNLHEKRTHLLELLENHYVQSFLNDEMESYGQGQMAGAEGNKGVLELTRFVASLIYEQNNQRRFLSELAGLVKQSDFVARIAFGKSFAAMANPDRYENYVRERNRVVYLDSQVVLYILCQGYTDEDFEYENPYFSAAAQLLALAKRDQSIQLFVSRRYVEEVAFHAKLALLLIPLAEHTADLLSSNVFFDFYWHLSREGRLMQGDQGFADFLRNWLDLYEADAMKSDYIVIGTRAIRSRLETDYGIRVIEVESNSNWHDAADALRASLSRSNQRPDLAVRADALMMVYLCENRSHTVEPFFLTWDGAFPRFRAKYLEDIRSNSTTFHLFNPAKFVNHMSLLRFKVNPQALTQDFLIVMEGIDSARDFVTLWDRINQLLVVDGLSTRQRRHLVSEAKQLLSNEFGLSVSEYIDESRAGKAGSGLDTVMRTINDHFNNIPRGLDNYRSLFTDEAYSVRLLSIIFATAKELSGLESMLLKIQEMISEKQGKGPSLVAP